MRPGTEYFFRFPELDPVQTPAPRPGKGRGASETALTLRMGANLNAAQLSKWDPIHMGPNFWEMGP